MCIVIKLEKIQKTYYSKHNSSVALNNLSLTLPNKGLIFIVGRSGCGKTTLLNILGGLDRFDSGKMICEGIDTSKFSSTDWDKYRNSYVGFVFQENNLLEEYNVYDNIRLATDLQNIKDSKEQIYSALRFVGLDNYAYRKIGELSGGQKQRVAIARAIAKESKLLLADEPTGSLDTETGRDIFVLLKDLSKHQLVVVVTHDLSSAKEFGDQIIEMQDGQIVNNTDEQNTIDCDDEKPFIAKKSVLNPKLCIKLSTNAFKKTPIRLIVLIILSMFGFSLMVGALKFSTWTPYDLQQKVLEREKVAILSLTPETIDLGGGFAREEKRYFATSKFKEFVENYKPMNIIGVADYSEEYNNQGFFRQLTDREQVYFNEHFSGVAAMNENDFNAYGFELLAGSFPDDTWGEYDIAISKSMYEVYTLTGFTNDGLENISITTYDDLIGRQFGGMYGDKYTIRGIVDTKFDRDEYENIKAYSLGYSDVFSVEWMKEFNVYNQKGFHNLMFVSPNYKNSSEKYSYIIINYDEEEFNNSDLINVVLDEDEYVFCDYYSQILKYQSTQTQKFGGIMLVIALVAILFAVILFANFITVSIQDKIRQIGILRAIGASKNHILTIFIIQNSIIALIVFAFSFIMVKYAIMPTLLILSAVQEFPFSWYELIGWDYLILFGIVVLTSIISSVLPMIKLSKKTPRELMLK